MSCGNDTHHQILAVGHCSADLVDKKMPQLVIEALREAHDVKKADISVYISSCCGKNWTYDKYPSWAKDQDLWKDTITLEKDGLYHIDLKKTVLKELKDLELKEILMSEVDTITNPEFYSNSASREHPEKDGRNFVGGFFAR